MVERMLAVPGTGVYVVNQAGDILWASPSMLQATGHRAEDLVGRNAWGVLVPPEDLREVARFKAHLTQADGIIWMRILAPDGSYTWSRVDTVVRDGLIVCAFRPERDKAEHSVHFALQPRDASEAHPDRSRKEH